MQIESFANAIIEDNDVELFTFLGDGGDLPPFARSYNEIAAMTQEIQENIARLNVLGDEIELSIQNINSSLIEEGQPPVSLARSGLQSPGRPAMRRLRRVPSMENLAAIDCERIAEALAVTFPDDPSISPGWLLNSHATASGNEIPTRQVFRDNENSINVVFGNGSDQPFQTCSCQIR